MVDRHDTVYPVMDPPRVEPKTTANVDSVVRERMVRLISQAAGKAGQAKAYMNTHSTKDVTKDIEVMIRQNPVRSLLGAVFIGFMVGRSLRD